MSKSEDISIAEARKLALVCQQLPTSTFGRGLRGVREAIEHLGYVQIDTISVVERSHHLTLWNRVPHYRQHYLDRLVRDRSILEYWAHAAAYLPMSDFRYTLPRMRAIASGQRHWYDRDPKLMKEILAQVRAEGPLQAKDIESHRGNAGGMWEWGPVKQSLEMLFMEGKLLVTRRDSFQKVFDLAERVVPADTDVSEPSRSEYAHWLIDRYLAAHGLGRHAEFGYLRRGMGPAVKTALDEKTEAGDIVSLRIKRNGALFFADKRYGSVLAQRQARNRVKFLSPFDNLIIQRKRVQQLFDFDYQLECYVPEGKRRYGYFCLPVLWRGRLVARMDAKADRKHRVFRIHTFMAEPVIGGFEEFARQAGVELRRMMDFHECDRITFGSASPRPLRGLLRKATQA
jgi:uncharacterized protein YcaQ